MKIKKLKIKNYSQWKKYSEEYILTFKYNHFFGPFFEMPNINLNKLFFIKELSKENKNFVENILC